MSQDKHSVQEYLDKMIANGVSARLCAAEFAKGKFIDYLSYNSKDVKKGTLFICKGEAFKEKYLFDAVEAGAEVYMSEVEYPNANAAGIIVSDIRKAMALAANLFYNDAWKNITILAITGTKGKSTTSYYIKSILDDYCTENGLKPPAVISGIEIYDGISTEEAKLTTPETLELHKHIANAVSAKMEYLILEVSSQALKYQRTFGIGFDRACFLNIGDDHISPVEHPDFEDYFNSKLKIFEQCNAAYVNLDSEHGDEIYEKAFEMLSNVKSFSLEKSADVMLQNAISENGRTNFSIMTTDGQASESIEGFCINMPGRFNVSNALAAISMCRDMGIPAQNIRRGLAAAKVKGRMQVYSDSGNKLFVIVDFAHNALSFEALFKCAKEEFSAKKISIVFGATGSKAVTRRYEMGKIAGRNANFSYITEDDPGDESVEKICAQIAEQINLVGGKCEIIIDRQEAINKAIKDADEDTLVIVAGKGEDGSQKRGKVSVKTPTDVEYVLEALNNKKL